MSANDYLSQRVSFGGAMVPLGEAVRAMRAEGHDPALIDRWAQGALVTALVTALRSTS